MSQDKQNERDADKKRKAIFAGNPGIRRDVWEEAMKLTEQSQRQSRGTYTERRP